MLVTQTLIASVAKAGQQHHVGKQMAKAKQLIAWQPGRAGATAAVTPQPGYRPTDETTRFFLKPAHFAALMRANDTTFFAGVPDSLLKDFSAYITDSAPKHEHVVTANEGTSIAAAAGHHLATGKIPCVYLQNSGLGDTVNPLSSLCDPKVQSIPALLLIGWQGEPSKKDEPQHTLQAALASGPLQESMIPHEVLPDHAEGAFRVLEKAYRYMRAEKAPFALLCRKDTFEKYDLQT